MRNISRTRARTGANTALRLTSPREKVRQGGRGSSSALTRHQVLYEPGDDGEDRATRAASDQLADNGIDVQATAPCAGKHRDQRLQDLAPADTADRAGDRVAERAEIVVLESGTGTVAADDSRNELDDQIGDDF